MNCKPGDLAIVVKIFPGYSDECLGRVIRVISLDRGAWLYEPPIMSRKFGFPFTHADDCLLRPIRDPGDSARDNAWDWLPAVPTKELA